MVTVPRCLDSHFIYTPKFRFLVRHKINVFDFIINVSSVASLYYKVCVRKFFLEKKKNWPGQYTPPLLLSSSFLKFKTR